MFKQLVSLFMAPQKASVPVPPPTATGASITECQQQVLARVKSGTHAFSSNDKEGYRTLCYHREAFLYVAVGDDGTSVLRLPNEEVFLDYLWRQSAYKLVLNDDGQYRWNYDLTEAEKLETWQTILARLSPFTEGSQRFVTSTLAEFAKLSAPQ
jgi:hypothetical protein